MAKSLCSECYGDVGTIEVRYEAVEYPYNPEWSVVRTDAARCCSDGCLVRYLARKLGGITPVEPTEHCGS